MRFALKLLVNLDQLGVLRGVQAPFCLLRQPQLAGGELGNTLLGIALQLRELRVAINRIDGLLYVGQRRGCRAQCVSATGSAVLAASTTFARRAGRQRQRPRRWPPPVLLPVA